MRRLLLSTALLFATTLAPPAAAAADFGVELYDVNFENADGTLATQAGSHPFAMNTRLVGVHDFDEETFEYSVDEDLKDFFAEQVAGLVGDATAYPRCKTADFLTDPNFRESLYSDTACDQSATAMGAVVSAVKGLLFYSPLLNLEPPPGVPVRLGWNAAGLRIILDVGIKQSGEHNATAKQINFPVIFPIIGAKVQVWGNPADPRHDEIRGSCLNSFATNGTGTVPDLEFVHADAWPEPSCPTKNPLRPFLTLPTSCTGPAESRLAIDSWVNPGAFLPNGEADLSDPNWKTGSVLTHDFASPPNPQGFTGCGKLGFNPSIEAKPTTRAAQSPTGLDFSLEVADEGLKNPDGLAASTIRKVVATLPEGMTANPSLAEGLEVCSQADLARETLRSEPGEGCPQASKIGNVEVQSPLIDRTIEGGLFMAKPYENPFDTLLALYVVLKDRKLGILVKQAGKVEPDPRTGQLLTTFEGIPQLPFSRFNLHFREGGRSPLISPPRCGRFAAEAELYPHSGTPPITAVSAFEVISGPNEGPCPPGGTPPFGPGFEAGSLNNAAGAYSPFYMRLTRHDGDQDMTKFSATLPPGVVGKLAGVSYCPEAAIAAARSRDGRDELARPSCPASSQIGRAVGGAGVASQLTYVQGKVYLAGPYNGAPLSVVAIVPAVAGPFDVGTVVTRQALRIDPFTAEVTADGNASDPIPHILAGIPLSVRDIRVYVDRPGFTLNPTSCVESSTRASLFGSFLDVFSDHDDRAVALSARYQAASCASLGFKPRLSLALKGGTRRGAHPSLRGVFRPRPGDANLARMVLRLPTSAFLDQSHIRTICTRVQFAADACPKGAIYGRARAWTPLLDTPLEGPVYLRSSNNNLPDFVAHLRGLVDVEAVARVDSARGGIRVTFSQTPDAPLSRVVVRMQGGKKGTIVNSRNLCVRPKRNRAKVRMLGHNGKRHTIKPVMRAVNCKKRRAKRSSHRSK